MDITYCVECDKIYLIRGEYHYNNKRCKCGRDLKVVKLNVPSDNSLSAPK